jgi:hypothetical protein
MARMKGFLQEMGQWGRRCLGGEAFAGDPVALQRGRRGVWRVPFDQVRLGESQDTDPTGLRPAGHRRGGSGSRKV